MIGFQKDGRRKRKSFYGRTKNEALEKMQDYRDDLKNGLQLDPKLLFGTWADIWFESHKENISPTTQASYGYLLDTLKGILGKRRLMDIRALDIENVLLDFRREGKSDSYVSKARGMLYQIMRKAEANELIRHPVQKLLFRNNHASADPDGGKALAVYQGICRVLCNAQNVSDLLRIQGKGKVFKFNAYHCVLLLVFVQTCSRC